MRLMKLAVECIYLSGLVIFNADVMAILVKNL